MRKSIIVSADCGYSLHFCGMQIFLQNQCYLLQSSRFDDNSVKILCNDDPKALNKRKQHISRRSEDNCHNNNY